MKKASIDELKAGLEKYLKASAKAPVVVMRGGRPVAVLYGVVDADEVERMLLACNPRFRKIVADARKSFAEGKGIPHDEFWRRMEQKYPDAFAKKSAKPRRPASKRAS